MHPSRAISEEQYSLWSWFLVHLCIVTIPPGFIFHFFDILIFRTVRVVKGQKMAQDDKNNLNRLLGWWGGWGVKGQKWSKMRKNYVYRAPYLGNHTSYDLLFMVLICKMIISPGVFFIFSKFWFSGLLGG